MRKGFGIITAIIIMMSIALLMSMSIGLSTATIKQTADVYQREEAELMLKSATELALLAISGHNNKVDCIKNMTIKDGIYQADVNIWYMGSSLPAACSNILTNSVVTKDSNLTAIIDVVVTATANSEPIRVHRRTIQKP